MEVNFILVEPAVPENVGAAARAIKTMGFGDLRLVTPCDHLDIKAELNSEDIKLLHYLTTALTEKLKTN